MKIFLPDNVYFMIFFSKNIQYMGNKTCFFYSIRVNKVM